MPSSIDGAAVRPLVGGLPIPAGLGGHRRLGHLPWSVSPTPAQASARAGLAALATAAAVPCRPQHITSTRPSPHPRLASPLCNSVVFTSPLRAYWPYTPALLLRFIILLLCLLEDALQFQTDLVLLHQTSLYDERQEGISGHRGPSDADGANV